MDLRPTIRNLAAAKAEKRPVPFPADAAWAFATQTFRSQKPREVMQFCAWMWKGGVHDLEFIKSCALRARSEKIRNPYSYFAKDGAARDCGLSQKAIAEAEADNNLRKAEIEKWLQTGRR